MFLCVCVCVCVCMSVSHDNHMLLCNTQGHTPSPEPGIDGTSLGDANERWTNPEKREFTVQVSTLAACGKNCLIKVCTCIFSQIKRCVFVCVSVCVWIDSVCTLYYM